MDSIQRAVLKSGNSKNPSQEVTPIKRVDNSSINTIESPKTNNQLFVDFAECTENTIIDAAGIRTPDLLEEFREIKRHLMRTADSKNDAIRKNHNLIMVSSCSPNEGKTFTAINLALSLALEIDRTVLLIDADMMMSGVANSLGISYEIGLIDYLTGSVPELSSLFVKTSMSNFSIIPSGTYSSSVAEYLGSEKMLCLADELSVRYPDRIIVIDTPPILASSIPVQMSELVGQVVLVVEAENTEKNELISSIEKIDKAKSISLVLNKVRGVKRKYEYSYNSYGGKNEA